MACLPLLPIGSELAPLAVTSGIIVSLLLGVRHGSIAHVLRTTNLVLLGFLIRETQLPSGSIRCQRFEVGPVQCPNNYTCLSTPSRVFQEYSTFLEEIKPL